MRKLFDLFVIYIILPMFYFILAIEYHKLIVTEYHLFLLFQTVKVCNTGGTYCLKLKYNWSQ